VFVIVSADEIAIQTDYIVMQRMAVAHFVHEFNYFAKNAPIYILVVFFYFPWFFFAIEMLLPKMDGRQSVFEPINETPFKFSTPA